MRSRNPKQSSYTATKNQYPRLNKQLRQTNQNELPNKNKIQNDISHHNSKRDTFTPLTYPILLPTEQLLPHQNHHHITRIVLTLHALASLKPSQPWPTSTTTLYLLFLILYDKHTNETIKANIRLHISFHHSRTANVTQNSCTLL